MNGKLKFLVLGELQSTAVPYSTFGSKPHDNNYIPKSINRILGEGHEIEWENGIWVAATKLVENLDNNKRDNGLIITLGHACHNSFEAICEYIRHQNLRGLWFPTFDSCDYDSWNSPKMEQGFSSWLEKNYKRLIPYL